MRKQGYRKRSAEEWQARQARMNSESEQTSQTYTMNSGTDKSDSNQLPQNLESVNHNNPIPPQSLETESVNTPHCSGVPVEDKIFRSTVVRDIGSLKSSVDILKAELQQLKGATGKCEGPWNMNQMWRSQYVKEVRMIWDWSLVTKKRG